MPDTDPNDVPNDVPSKPPAEDEEPLTDINGNPIPRNWNPGAAAPAAPDAEPPAKGKPPRATGRPAPGGPRPASPGGGRPPGAAPPARPPHQSPTTSSRPAPAGGFAEGEEGRFDLAGNPLPALTPSAPPPGAPGSYPPPGSYSAPGSRPGASPSGYAGVRRYTTSVNGTLILTLGILSLLGFCVLGPVAWVLGNNGVAAIDRGDADPSQRGSANGGRICGMIESILLLLGVLLYVAASIFLPALLKPILTKLSNPKPGAYSAPHGSGSYGSGSYGNGSYGGSSGTSSGSGAAHHHHHAHP